MKILLITDTVIGVQFDLRDTINKKMFPALSCKHDELLLFANRARRSDSFNDVTIQVGSERFPCNKMVLSCYSPYFKSMFQTEMQEKYQDSVELQGFDAKCIKLLINYMYGETIIVDDENVLQVLAASDYMQLQRVKQFCIDFLDKGLTVNNCLDAFTVYRSYTPPELLPDHICKFITEHFDAVFQNKQFKNLDSNNFSYLLANLDKNRVNQKSMFLVISSWVTYNQEKRNDEFSSLFDLVDLSKLSTEFIEEVVHKNPLVAQNLKCLQSVLQTMFHKHKQLKLGNTESNGATIEGCSKILSLGGVDRSSVVEIYSLRNKPIAIFPDLPTELRWHCAENYHNALYCVGGSTDDSTKQSRSTLLRMNLNAHDKKWNKLVPMTEARSFHATAIFKDHIVVCGGSFDMKTFSTAEAFDIHTNHWKTLSAMNKGRTGHALVVCDDELYAIGGFVNPASLCAEKLHNLQGRWQIIQSLNTQRNRLAAVCLDGVIYAIGGNSSNKTENSVEKFVPKEKMWSYVCSMNNERYGHAACVLQGKIYVTGGKNQNDAYVTTIECYDPKENIWSIVSEDVCPLEGHAVIAV